MVFDNDFSGSAKYYDIILDKKTFEKNARFVKTILQNHKVCSVLELGCGSGLYLLPLKKAGFAVEGLDISKEMLAILKKANNTISLYQKDMSSFNLKKKFDAIICLNSSLVLLPSFALIEKTLRVSAKHLHPDGLLLLDLPNHQVEIAKKDGSQDVEHYEFEKGYLDVIFRDYKKGNKWISEWFGFGKEKNEFFQFKEYYEELIFSPVVFERALKHNGFKVIALFGSRKGGIFNSKNSLRRFYVCKKA